jgi:hypothetical protein
MVRATLAAATALLALPSAAGAQYGESGPATIRVVESLDPSTLVRTRQVVHDLTPQEIRSIQRALRAEGYEQRWLSGLIDDPTRQNLRDLQDDRGLVACGCPSYESIVALGLKPSVIMTVVAEAGVDPEYRRTQYRAAVYYPIPVPILVPVDPDDGGDGNGDGNSDGSSPPILIPQGATTQPNPVGLRPAPPGRVAPPQTRVGPATGSGGASPRIVH